MGYKKIGFIGLGLIGGSIARAIKEKRPAIRIYGHASHEETIAEAYNAGVIENMRLIDLDQFADMDMLFLCGPVGVNIEYLESLKPVLSPHCIITDVGSVKGDIHRAIDRLGLSGQFIGGHPMTGSEKTGFSNSSSLLLENAYYILTTDEPSLSDAVDEFAGFLSLLGAIPIRMTPDRHDHATAAISHLPHVVAAALVNLVHDNDDPNEIMKTIAAGGFRDITRISSSSPVMWQHICMANRDEILNLIDIYDEELQRFRSAIDTADEREIASLFSAAKNYRDSMPIKNKGLIPSVYESYLDIQDEVGGIAKIANVLAEHEISIKNIGIIHNREYEDGVLRIEFYHEQDQLEAELFLSNLGYVIHKK